MIEHACRWSKNRPDVSFLWGIYWLDKAQELFGGMLGAIDMHRWYQNAKAVKDDIFRHCSVAHNINVC